MFETIATEIQSGVTGTEAKRITNELLTMRRSYPDAIVYNQPEAWLRTVWYESDLLFRYLLCRDQYRLFGVLIYSDMDEEFAEFVRSRADALSAMIGESCLLFCFDGRCCSQSDLYLGSQYLAYRAVVDRPGRFEDRETAADFDALRSEEAQMLSEPKGLNRSIPFGRRLGIPVRQTPCIALWESLDAKEIATFSFAGLDGDDCALARAFKQVADAIAETALEPEDQLLTRLDRRLAAVERPVANGKLELYGSVGEIVRTFLLRDTPPLRDRLWLEDVDNFAKAREVKPEAVLNKLGAGGYLDMAEDEIQRLLERILGEPFHKKDWGGELNDLYSANVTINGLRMPTAFLLKGHGLRKTEMQISDCGKNGDQIVRLFASPAYVFVIQFVGRVSEAVICDLQGKVAEKRGSGKPAWFLVLDGQETARLVHAYEEPAL